MLFTHLSVVLPLALVLALALAAAAATTIIEAAESATAPMILSTGGKASCISGLVKVTVTATNTKLLYSGPADQFAATQTVVELLKVSPTIYNTTNGGDRIVHGAYKIFSKLCFPTDPSLARNLQTVQFLIHGATLGIGYWDIAPGYSYVDVAAQAGYATFSYDQLGVGKSEHPDPIQIVQATLEVEIAHALISALRTAGIGPHAFNTVVGVGHSAGANIVQGVTTKYPKDFDAAILSGISISNSYLGPPLASWSAVIANTDPSRRFLGIANGYLTQATPQSIQFSFYNYPYFDPKIFRLQVADKETIAIGKLLTSKGIIGPSLNFTGPVDVILGENDFPTCGGDCFIPSDQSALVTPAFYPAASKGSQHYLVPHAGHNFNAHYAAPKAFAQMIHFLKKNGIH
ncbi:hypothetical protein MMC29_000630 [Sticta canariensis]|nr:hypothetical protein [Sticta canariensis]